MAKKKLKVVGLSKVARLFLSEHKHSVIADKGSLDSYSYDGDYVDVHMSTFKFFRPVRIDDIEVPSLYEDVQAVFDTKRTRYVFTCLRNKYLISRTSLWSLNDIRCIMGASNGKDLNPEFEA